MYALANTVVSIPIGLIYVLAYGAPALFAGLYWISLLRKPKRISLPAMCLCLITIAGTVAILDLAIHAPLHEFLQEADYSESKSGTGGLSYELYPDSPLGPIPWMTLLASLWLACGWALGDFFFRDSAEQDSPKRNFYVALIACGSSLLANGLYFLGIATIVNE